MFDGDGEVGQPAWRSPVLRSAVGATDKRPFSRAMRENYSDGVFGHWTPNKCWPMRWAGVPPRLWIGIRDERTKEPGRPQFPFDQSSSLDERILPTRLQVHDLLERVDLVYELLDTEADEERAA